MNKFDGDTHVAGHFSATSITLPAGTVDNNSIDADAAIEASKLEHRNNIFYQQPIGTAVVAAIVPIYVCRAENGAAVIDLFTTIVGAIATGGDRTITIDIKKSTAGGAPATILSSTKVLNNASVLYTHNDFTINDDDLVEGDILIAYITVAGVASAQGQGLVIGGRIDEQPT